MVSKAASVILLKEYCFIIKDVFVFIVMFNRLFVTISFKTVGVSIKGDRCR